MGIVKIPGHRHIGDGGIAARFAGGVLHRQGIADALTVVKHSDPAGSAGRSIAVQGGEFSFFTFILVQFVDLVKACLAGRNAGTLEADVAAFVAHPDAVQFQIGVGQVVDFHLGFPAGFQFSLAVQVVGLHSDIAAADGNGRDFHIADGEAAGFKDLDGFSFRVLFRIKQAPLFHLVQDTLALLHIPQVGGQLGRIAGAVIRNQLFQRRQLGAQLGSVVHGTGSNILFLHQRFLIVPAGVGHLHIKLRQFIVHGVKRSILPFVIFPGG